MSFIAQLNRRRVLLGGGGSVPSLPDYSGFNLTRLYAPFKTNVAVLNNMCELTRASSIGTPLNIPFNALGKPDYSQIVLADDTVDWYYNKIFCQITGHSIDGDSTISDANQWCTGWIGSLQANANKNGEASYLFKSGSSHANDGMMGVALPELNEGNDYSIVTVVSNNTPNSLYAVLSTSYDNPSRFTTYKDSTTNKRHSEIKNTTGAIYIAGLLVPNYTLDTEVIVTTVNSATKEITSYLNGVLQNTVTYTGAYVNDIIRFGEKINAQNRLVGDLQTVGIANVVWSTAEITDITNRLQTQFSL